MTIAKGDMVVYGHGLTKTVNVVHCEHLVEVDPVGLERPQLTRAAELTFAGYLPVWRRKAFADDGKGLNLLPDGKKELREAYARLAEVLHEAVVIACDADRELVGQAMHRLHVLIAK